jgi:hypothetical protein
MSGYAVTFFSEMYNAQLECSSKWIHPRQYVPHCELCRARALTIPGACKRRDDIPREQLMLKRTNCFELNVCSFQQGEREREREMGKEEEREAWPLNIR